MIALLFALLTAAIGLAWIDRRRIAYAVFAATILLSIYWLKFHATSPLTIQL